MTTVHGFELVSETKIEELNTLARRYRHLQTGADLLSLVADDENKVFGITFRTPPPDSTGVAHILEHSVLGGSKKYPLKEPFVQLIKGSLKTFLNAMTYPDRTVYPVAGTNLQDFYNLVDVYLDAVLHPLITPHHLDQEGWHYELEQIDGELKYKGVVFNEMKGAYSSPEGLLYRISQQALYPDTAYGLDSGGDPAVIPNLTYAQFKAFHTTYYHPSNALIYFYGDDDPTERLRLLDNVLRDFEAQPIAAEIAEQPRFVAPKRITRPYGVDAASDQAPKAFVQINWLLPSTPADATTADDEATLVMSLSMLAYTLLGTQASPLRKRLTDSGLGEDVTGGGLSTTLREMSFSAGMKGVVPGQEERVEQLILEILTDLAATGIEQEMIDAAYNTFEFSLRENNTGSLPRGLSIMFRSLRNWLYGGDPLTPLAYEAPLAAVRQALTNDPTYLQTLIRTYLLDNPHRVTVVLTPDMEYNAQRAAEEQARLDAAAAALDDATRAQIVANTQELKRRQEAQDPPELLALLPTLKLSDLEPEVKSVPTEFDDIHGGTLLYHDLFTNGIVYLELGFDLHGVAPDLLPYARLFAQALTEMGTETEDFVRLSQRIGRTTGGIHPSSFISARRDGDELAAWLMVHGKATLAQAPAMLDILRDILLTVRLDNRDRLRQIVLKNKARIEGGLTPGGHSMVDGRLRAAYSTASWASEQWSGLDHLFFLRRLTTDLEQDWEGVLAKLEAVRAQIVNRRGMVVNVTLDEASWTDFAPQLRALIADLPAHAPQPRPWQHTSRPTAEGLSVPAQINFVGKGANLYDLGYTYDGSIHVIANHLRTSYLWDKIRVQGGAYGAFCRFDRQSGVWTFLSYRDPNLLETLEVYDRTSTFLQGLELGEDDLTKSIIGAISSLDAYQLPDAKGYSALGRYLVGETDATRQATRDQVLSTTAADFRAFAEVMEAVRQNGRVVVLGAADTLQKANAARGDFMQIQRVL
jgi:Zn-dependent M16 (insulinase) family peptidase